jgi:hypothetical protein
MRSSNAFRNVKIRAVQLELEGILGGVVVSKNVPTLTPTSI